MIANFEELENAIGTLEKYIETLKHDNEELTSQIAALKSTVDDRDLEILQLQENAQKESAQHDSAKAEVESRIEGLLGRVRAMSPDNKA